MHTAKSSIMYETYFIYTFVLFCIFMHYLDITKQYIAIVKLFLWKSYCTETL